ncbi:MAG: AraC family transcriptional regulator [Verrucomicrobiota bacterium]|nr:AraC family transcriptional regulator [Verrucomicrobiota bacterium]
MGHPKVATDVLKQGRTKAEHVLNAENCPELIDVGIFDVGWTEPKAGYQVERICPSFSHMTFCVRGEGEVLIQNEWVPFREGMAALSPKLKPHGSRKTNSDPWCLCWVIFDSNRDPLAELDAAELLEANCAPVWWIIRGIIQEVNTTNSPAARFHWTALLQETINRVRHGGGISPRLAHICDKLRENPAHPWTVNELADLVPISPAQLRRLFLKEIGKTPMVYLLDLRMRRAMRQLALSNQKIRDIALTVGYNNEFAFSTAFRKYHGQPPSAYREIHQ